jgi:hypothetical protein
MVEGMLKEKIRSGAVVSGPIVAESDRLAGSRRWRWLATTSSGSTWSMHVRLGDAPLTIQYARAVGIAPVVRVTDLSYAAIARALDAGAVGVVVPRVETVAQVEEAVACARYPPTGGAVPAARRASSTSRHAGGGHRRVGAETVVVVQVETVGAAEQIDAIAAVPGSMSSASGRRTCRLARPPVIRRVPFVETSPMSSVARSRRQGRRDGRAGSRSLRAMALGRRPLHACNTDLNMIAASSRADVAALKAMAAR